MPVEDLWLHLALVLGDAPGVVIGVFNILKSSIDANGANNSSSVRVLVATLAIFIVLVELLTKVFLGLNNPMINLLCSMADLYVQCAFELETGLTEMYVRL